MGVTYSSTSAGTYMPIATYTLTGSGSSYTFSAISSAYTDLVLIASVIPTGSLGYGPWLQFNGDTGTNYSVTWMQGNGSTTSSSYQPNVGYGYLSYSTGLSGSSNFIANIQNYSNTTTYKTYINRLGEYSGTYPGTVANVGLWRSTSAISSVKIGTSGTFNTGTQFTLYGIKAA